jgi:hypothetical protein
VCDVGTSLYIKLFPCLIKHYDIKTIGSIINFSMEQDRVTVKLYIHFSVRAGFESLPGHQISSQAFRGAPQIIKGNVGIGPGSGHDHFLPNPLQFFNHPTTRNYILSILTVK